MTSTTDVPLYWAAYGSPEFPRLLVLHGGPGASHDYLLPQMLSLADHHEMMFYDQRGGGRSRTEDRTPITWHTQVDDLGRVAAELAGAPLTLVGYSWGGLLALLYATSAAAAGALAPARLVLIDPAPATRELRDEFEREFARRQNSAPVQALRAELAASGLRERDPEAYRQRAFEISVAGYFSDPRRARDLTPFRVVARVQQSVWESLGDFDIVPAFRTLSCPTLIVHGLQDPIPLASSQMIAEALPDAQLVTIDDCGHVPYVEAPDVLFPAVRAFLDSATPPTPR